MTDEAAMQLVASGDLDKAAILYERYKRPLYNFYLRFGVERDSSQDLTQQVFYRIIHYRNSFRDGYEFRTWIYRIARNIYHDFLKEHSHNHKDLHENIEVAEEENYDDEQYLLIQKALKKLPQEYQEVLTMSRYDELKYEEIADILNISVSLVKVRVHRGLKQLKEEYLKLN
ncbi:RNA polymerase sigma factor [Emticicia sp. C21]|uniref:RNA polymerase sigma factor n=1 Tax=Emticicia sp. C21 TaxID=2302915 RepID=UPI000E3535DF|nr:sigma-70 family RNA polymerase sigma factor [Emticicia sp. C21]RFS13738.1 sigma-70 family RNA polymerase sigma factor [Emticicia sp. C21]